MSANINDKFNKASNMGGSYPPVATVAAARSTGGSTLSCDSLAGWATDTPVHFSTFKLNTDGTVDTTTQTDWKGIVVGNTITEMTRLAGAADSGNASGDKVELNPTIGWLDDLITGLLVSHKQNGALKDSAVTTSSIAPNAVTAAKIDFSTLNPARKTGSQGQWLSLSTTRTDLLDRITISESGKYLAIARAFVDVASGAGYISICKNGVLLTNASEGAYGQHSLVSVTMEEFAAGDVVYMQGKTDGAGTYYDSRDRLEFIVLRVG